MIPCQGKQCPLAMEIDHHVLCLNGICLEVVPSTPFNKVSNDLPVLPFVPLQYTSNVSSENIWTRQMSVLCLKSYVCSVKRKGESTVPCGAPIEQTTTSDTHSQSLMYCDLLVRKVFNPCLQVSVHTNSFQFLPQQ